MHITPDPKSVAHHFANYLFALSQKSGALHVALSGGSTPQLLFDVLAADFKNKIDWTKLHFYWGDERCVPPGDPDSNFGMTKNHLFDHVAVPEKNIHRILGENEPLPEAGRYGREIEKNLPQANNLPCFDLIILGLGTDGHTASIFPHQMELLQQKEICAVATHPDSGQKRVSLTGPVINNAREVAFLVTGAGKKEKIGEIMHQKGNWRSYPAAFVQPTDGKLHWFMDEAAAG